MASIIWWAPTQNYMRSNHYKLKMMWITCEMVGATPSSPVVSILSDCRNQVWLVCSNHSIWQTDLSDIVEYVWFMLMLNQRCWLWELDATIAIRGNLNESKWWDDIANDKGGDNEADLGCDDHNKGVANLNENAANKNQKELCSTLKVILIKMMMILNHLDDEFDKDDDSRLTSIEPISASLGRVANNRVIPPIINVTTAILTHHWKMEWEKQAYVQ